jgi:hypothetical protein
MHHHQIERNARKPHSSSRQTHKSKCSLLIIACPDCCSSPLFIRFPNPRPNQPNVIELEVTACHTFNAASFAFTLANTSGSGAGSTFAGPARGQDSHFGCLQRTHSGGAAPAADFPSSESGCGRGGKTLLHLWQAYFTGLEVSSE